MIKTRENWLDVAKGFTIVLVVLGHAIQAILQSNPNNDVLSFLDKLIYSFHMPVFCLEIITNDNWRIIFPILIYCCFLVNFFSTGVDVIDKILYCAVFYYIGVEIIGKRNTIKIGGQ